MFYCHIPPFYKKPPERIHSIKTKDKKICNILKFLLLLLGHLSSTKV